MHTVGDTYRQTNAAMMRNLCGQLTDSLARLGSSDRRLLQHKQQLKNSERTRVRRSHKIGMAAQKIRDCQENKENINFIMYTEQEKKEINLELRDFRS